MLNHPHPPHVTMAHPLPFFTASLSASSVPPRSASVANSSGPPIANGGAVGGPNITSSPSPDIQHVTTWDASKVAAWIVSAGFNGYDRRFLENDISGDVLVHLNDEFLQEMVIDKVGTRIAMLKAIYALKKMHGVPIEAGDFVPLVDPTDASKSTAPSERKRSLFSFFDSHHSAGEPADPRRIVETLRHQADQMQRMSNEISQLTSELQRLREDVNPLIGRTSTSSSRMGTKKSPTLLTRSLTSAGLSNPMSASTPALNSSGASASSTSAWSPPPMPGVAVPPATDDASGTIKVYGDRLPSRQHDGYKSFKVHRDETCSTFLPSVLRKYKINDDWSQYALFIVPGAGNERCLGYDEYPFRVYTEYFVTAPASPEPYFVLRHIKQASALLSRDGGRPTAAYATKESTDLKYRGGTSRTAGGNATPPTSTANIDQPIVPSLPPTLPPPIPPAPATGPIIGIPTSSSSASASTFRTGTSDSAASSHRPTPSPSMPTIPSISAPPTSADGPTITDDPLPPPTESSGAVAVYEYNAQRPDELSLIIGDRVVIRSRSTGWCVVDKDGETGWVPAGCLIEENKGENEIEGKRGRVLFDYDKIGPNELSIKKGEALTLVKGYQHWLLVESLAGVRGWVPSCYVTISKSRTGGSGGGAGDKDGAKKPRSGSPVPDLVKG
ncbi:hypothetical protein BCR44DRAFT_378999, partial [Catenaria anguillulae PL171]